MKLVKVKDHPNLRRDVESNAIINVDSDARKAYLNKRNKILEQIEKEKETENQINSMKEEISEIKKMLLKLLEKEKLNG